MVMSVAHPEDWSLPPVRCPHTHRRCIHGDEIIHRMKVYTFRWWKPSVLYRQMCLDCKRPLDRDAICWLSGDPTKHYAP